MKKILFILLLFCISFNNAYSQNYTREGNTFISSTGERSNPIKTKFTWKDNKNKEYPVYISSNGSCFVIKVSAKTGKEYRNYLGPEISQQICKELNVKYNGKKGK